MQLFGTRERVALGFGPDRVRLLVAKANGELAVRHADSESLPEGALRSGLRAPTMESREAVFETLRRLVERARAAGRLKRDPELVTVALFDGGVKMTLAPLEGGAPSRQQGDRMARWMLRELLPGEEDSVRVDWALVGGDSGAGADLPLSIFSVGASRDLVLEYEQLVQELGWQPGRVVPWTLACAAALEGDADRTLLLCEGDGALASVFEDGGAIRFHRAWRARVPAEGLGAELVSLQRYVAEHLETSIAGAVICGSEIWCAAAAKACERIGVEARSMSPEQALLGAVRG